MQAKTKYALSGTAAGLVNGLFGGGGGMVLVPLLNGWCGLAGKQAFATCVAAILPLSAVSAAVYLLRQAFDWAAALPYLIGGLVGGLVGGRLFRSSRPPRSICCTSCLRRPWASSPTSGTGCWKRRC